MEVVKWRSGRMQTLNVKGSRDHKKFDDNERDINIDENEEQEIHISNFVVKDFFLFLFQYLIPPLCLVIDRFADYPLHANRNFFRKLKWIFQNSLFAILTISVTLYRIYNYINYNKATTNAIQVDGALIGGFEAFLPLLLFILRSFATSYLEAVNVPTSDIIQRQLINYKIITLNGEITTADRYYQTAMQDSNYDPRVRFNNLKHLTFLAIFTSFTFVLLPYFYRFFYFQIIFLGKLEMLFTLLSSLLTMIVMSMFLRSFFQSFSLYKSMISSMIRFRKLTVNLEQTPNKQNEEKVLIDITIPQNLRAWVKVRDALDARKFNLEARVVNIVATVMLFLLILFLMLLFVNSHSSGDEHQYKHNHSLQNLASVNLILLFYLTCLMSICILTLTQIGSTYNYISSTAFLSTLYDIEIQANFNIHCNQEITEERREELKSSLLLLPIVRSHLQYHTKELGLIGISYSKLYWYIFGVAFPSLLNLIIKKF